MDLQFRTTSCTCSLVLVSPHSVRSLLRSLGTWATGAAEAQRMSGVSHPACLSLLRGGWRQCGSIALQLFCLFVYFSDKCFVFNPVTRVMQTTCLQPSTHYWTFTSYSWLIRLLGCKLVRAGTTFDLYIGFAFSMLVTILTQQVLYEHL